MEELTVIVDCQGKKNINNELPQEELNLTLEAPALKFQVKGCMPIWF